MNKLIQIIVVWLITICVYTVRHGKLEVIDLFVLLIISLSTMALVWTVSDLCENIKHHL
jgi:hypothetical protein